jgi:hypothetical protein
MADVEEHYAGRGAGCWALRLCAVRGRGWDEEELLTKILKLAERLNLPLDAVTQKIVLLGMSGSGKTNGMVLLAEQMLDAHAQVVLIDPKGELYGLRLLRDGKPGYPIPVFGGEHGDVPLHVGMGNRVAELIVKNDYSAVLDLSEFSDAELAHFGYDFATRLLLLKKQHRSAMALMIDEAQDFIPQNPAASSKGRENYEPRMLHAFSRLQKQGRACGIGLVIAGQRPQEVSKKVLNLCECWITFQMTGLQERKTTVAIIGEKDKEAGDAIDSLLPRLEVGAAYVWSPRWLKVSGLQRILEKKTFDASATPEVGARKIEARKLSPVDVLELTTAMQDVIETAKADDPKELKRQVAELSKTLRGYERAAKPAPQVETRTIEIPVITPSDLARIEALGASLAAGANALVDLAGEISAGLKSLGTSIAKVGSNGNKSAPLPARKIERKEARYVHIPEGGLPQPQQDILDALAWFEQVGIQTPSRANVAAIVGKSLRSSGFNNNISALSSAGLVTYPEAGKVQLTDAGSAAARQPEHQPSLESLHNAWLTSPALSPPQREILSLLLGNYPDALTRESLAVLTHKSANSSGFNNNISALSSLGIARYPAPGLVAASPLLFPEGLC